MASTTTTHTKRRELAHRASNGIEVSLFWGPSNGEIVVEVFDWSSEQYFELSVPSECALDAFHHPYAYAALRAIHTTHSLGRAA
jgi:hypothetical protein